MNERIKQLAEQAGCKVMDDGEWYIPSAAGLEKVIYTSGVGLEKFAELIVQECLDIASEVRGEPATDTHYVIGYDRACEKMIDGIKEHFGVEE